MNPSAPIAQTSDFAQRMQAAADRENWGGLLQLCSQALEQDQESEHGLKMHGLALSKLGREREAKIAYERALRFMPDSPTLNSNYSITLSNLGDYQGAYQFAGKAARLAPDNARLQLNLLAACVNTKLHEEAIATAKTALNMPLAPEMRAMVLNNLANTYRIQGRISEAVATFEQAIAQVPGSDYCFTNLILTLQSDPTADDARIFSTLQRYAQVIEAPYQPFWPAFDELADSPVRRLRIGFLSPDFNNHPVLYFTEGLLAQLDREQFSVECFHLNHRCDDATQRFVRYADQFHSIAGLSIEAQLAKIRERRIDILIDLAGHTADNGLCIMARKAAPVQMSWLGFPGSTGLRSIDWRITDPVASPPGEGQYCTERLARLPRLYAAYRPLARALPWRYLRKYAVQPTPALKNGFVTFGCCNHLAKISDEVLALWGQVLARVRHARLLVEGHKLEEPAMRAAFVAKCARAGIAESQLILVQRDSANQYLTYNRIDIALDPFPLTGGTTSFDTLWMGVPLVTLHGTSYRSRMSMTALHALGRSEWIAKDKDDYVAIACQLAEDLHQLNALRLGLREEMEASPLTDETTFTRTFGKMLRDVWWQWLAGRQINPQLPQEERIQQMGTLFKQWNNTLPRTKPQARVCIDAGKSLGRAEAEKILAEKLATARAMATGDPQFSSAWQSVEAWSHLILAAIPGNPCALQGLAETENGRGNMENAADFARAAELARQRDESVPHNDGEGVRQ